MSVSCVKDGDFYVCQRDGTLADVSLDFVRQLAKRAVPNGDAEKRSQPEKVQQGSLITVKDGKLLLVNLASIGSSPEEVLKEFEKSIQAPT